MPMTKSVTCEQCGVEFVVPWWSTKRFCDASCYRTYQLNTDRPIAERFWEKVEKTAGCWLWTGQKHPQGYGFLDIKNSSNKRVVLIASRVIWEWENGPIPDGMQVCHSCDNPPCVNPAHLFLGTNQDNIDDKVAKGRQMKGEAVPNSIVTEAEVIEMRRRHAAGEMQKDLAVEFGISRPTMSNIIRGVTWKHLLP